MSTKLSAQEIGVSECNLGSFFEEFRGRKIGEWPEILNNAKCAVIADAG